MNERQQRTATGSGIARLALACAVALLAAAAGAEVTNGWNQAVAGTYDYTNTANWYGGVVNDLFDRSLVATGGNQVLTFSADHTFASGLRMAFDNATYSGGGASTNNFLLSSDGAANRTVTFGGDVVFTPLPSTGARLLTIGSTINGQRLAMDLGGATRVFTNNTDKASDSDIGAGITLAGVVTNGAVVKTGQGWLRLGGGITSDLAPNTFTNLTISGGVVRLQKTNGVNAVNGDILINGGVLIQVGHQIPDTASVNITSGTWYVAASSVNTSGNSPVSETISNLTISGGTLNTSPKQQGSSPAPGVDTVLGTMRVTGGSVLLRNTAFTAARLEITTSMMNLYNTGGSSISYAKGTQLIVGPGGLAISNTVSGVYTAIVAGAWSRVRIGGNVVLDGNGSNTNTVMITAAASATPPTYGPLTNDFRAFSLEGGNRTFTINDGAAAVDLLIGTNFTIIDSASNTIGSLTKAGSGTLEIDCAGIYTGATDVATGRLLVNGPLANTTSAVVRSGATLGGTGSIGTQAVVTVQTGGTLTPGNGQGTASPGLLTLGSLTLQSGSTLAVELNGTAAGTNYDQVAANGTVALGGAALTATLGYAPAVGDKLFIVANAASSDVSGTFGGLPEGSSLVLTNAGKPYAFKVGYHGDSVAGTVNGGNDVVLSLQTPGTMVMVR